MIKMFHGLISNTNGNYDTRLSSYYDHVFKYTVRAPSFVLILTLLVTLVKNIFYIIVIRKPHTTI